MGEIAVNQNSTIVLPVPVDLLRPYLDRSDGSSDGYAQEQHEGEREAVGDASREVSGEEIPRGGERP
jgi:hypothetical protein